MGRIVKANQPCPFCTSSDAFQIYEDGGGKCFSCGKFAKNVDKIDVEEKVEEKPVSKFKPKSATNFAEEIEDYPVRGFRERKIKKDVCAFYGVKISYDADGDIAKHYYPYDGGKGYNIRTLPKDFKRKGKITSLFGQDKFAPGTKRLVICEGEIDTLSMATASYNRYQKFYPIVGVPGVSNEKLLLENRDWIRSFKEVIIMPDMDDAGKDFEKKAIKIIGVDKVRLANLPLKDANEVLVELGSRELLTRMFDAAKYIPEGIISTENLWKALEEYNAIESLPYPDCLRGVNSKIKGMRFGEIALFISGSGSGKSSIFREIMLHIHEQDKNTKIGVVSLEESPPEVARKLSAMPLKRNPSKETIPLEELREGFVEVFGDDRFIVLDHQGSMADNSIVEQLEYMALAGAKYLFVDHLTLLVSEGADGLEGNEAIDKVMNDLLRLTKRHNIWLGLVSHLRKVPSGGKSFEEGVLPTIDDVKGSGSIKQISFDIISFARDMTEDDPIKRNTIMMAVLKSRYSGLTGPVNGAFYDYNTGRLEHKQTLIREVVKEAKPEYKFKPKSVNKLENVEDEI